MLYSYVCSNSCLILYFCVWTIVCLSYDKGCLISYFLCMDDSVCLSYNKSCLISYFLCMDVSVCLSYDRGCLISYFLIWTIECVWAKGCLISHHLCMDFKYVSVPWWRLSNLLFSACVSIGGAPEPCGGLCVRDLPGEEAEAGQGDRCDGPVQPGPDQLRQDRLVPPDHDDRENHRPPECYRGR